jgi:hypothetical protein
MLGHHPNPEFSHGGAVAGGGGGGGGGGRLVVASLPRPLALFKAGPGAGRAGQAMQAKEDTGT